MPVAPNANALLLLDEVRGDNSPLAITGTDQDAMIQTLINRASDWIEDYCNRLFVARPFTMRLPGQAMPHLRPPATPLDLVAPLTVSVNGVAQTIWRTEADGDPAGKQVVVGADVPGTPTFLYRAAGWCGTPPTPILLTYTGGHPFAALPGDLKEAAQLVVQTLHRHWRNLEPMQAMPAGATGGLVTFRTDHVPMAAISILNQYRIIPV